MDDSGYGQADPKLLPIKILLAKSIWSEQCCALTPAPGALMIRVYLDTCCFSRPSDDQTQLRVKLESEAILDILERAARGEWMIIGSDAVQAELSAIPDTDRRLDARALAGFAGEDVRADEGRRQRGEALERMGLAGYDSVHVACAEAADADVLLTTDDTLIRRAHRLRHALSVRVANPLTWLKEWPE